MKELKPKHKVLISSPPKIIMSELNGPNIKHMTLGSCIEISIRSAVPDPSLVHIEIRCNKAAAQTGDRDL